MNKTLAWTAALLATYTLGAAQSFAAIPRKPEFVPTSPNVSDNELMEALKLPAENRVQAVRANGLRSWQRLSEWVFDPSRSLEVRWRALTTLPQVDRRIGKQVIEKALASQEWYLRNAATIALPSLDREFALEQTDKLLSDPALVVRTAAVQNLLRLNGVEKSAVLWQKLNAPENFKNGESLWIRRHIARALAEFAKPGQEQGFVAMLNDRDQRLYVFGVRGLEKITGRSLGAEVESVRSHRNKWLAWWAKSRG